jgi:hypothetical protein
MNHGRQLRLFLADGTSSGPRFYEILPRTIQALCIPATRIKELMSSEWPGIQKSGVYLVHGVTENAEERLYIGKGENVASRVQIHPEKLDFEVTALLLFSSKDENLLAGQVAWLEATLIRAARDAKRISVANIQTPSIPPLSKPELATIHEFLEDLTLISQTAGFDFFSKPKKSSPVNISANGGTDVAQGNSPEFTLGQAVTNLHAVGYLSDEGFVVKAGSYARAKAAERFSGGYAALRQHLIAQGVLVPKQGSAELLTFAVDYVFTAPSAASSVILGCSSSGNAAWSANNQPLGDYLKSLSQPATEAPPSTGNLPLFAAD